MKPLVIPPAAQRDNDSIQMVSAWVAENGLHCSLNVGMWLAQGHSEARAWGILLADLARHVANAIQDESGVPNEQSLQEIVTSLLDEVELSTSRVIGGFSPGHS